MTISTGCALAIPTAARESGASGHWLETAIDQGAGVTVDVAELGGDAFDLERLRDVEDDPGRGIEGSPGLLPDVVVQRTWAAILREAAASDQATPGIWTLRSGGSAGPEPLAVPGLEE